MCLVARFLNPQTGFLDQMTCFLRRILRHFHVHKMFIMYQLICAKMSIFPPKMAQETIQYGQEMSQDGQELCHRVQESSLEHKLN